jgi:hypothetical protein
VGLAAARGATLTTAGNRATYRSANLIESYLAGPLGLEQTLTIPRRPRGPLEVTMGFATGLRARLAAGVLTLSEGQDPVIRYGGLSAVDAAGRQLRAWMTLAPGNRLRIHVADAGARFPIRIDPFVQAAELSAADGSAGDGFGDSVAISGSTVVAGAPQATIGSNTSQGAAYVFTATSGRWATTMSATKLTAGAAGEDFGISVAVSGSVVVVGAFKANSGSGAAYVFQEPKGGWSSGSVGAPAVLTPSDAATGFGFAVATDGTMVVAGASRTISVKQPVLYAFTEPGGGWASASGSTELVASNPGTGLQGHAVAVEGTTVVAGANSANDSEGAVYVFVPPPGGWSSTEPNDETATLTEAAPAVNDSLGWSVAISGSTVVAGAPGVNESYGAVDVFQEPSGGWGTPATQTPAATLTAPAAASGQLGDSVGIETADAPPTIVAGAPYATFGGNQFQGAVDVFQEGADGWTGATPQTLTAADGASEDRLGGADGNASGPLGIDGTTIVAGAPFHASEVGSAYVFQEPMTSTSSSTSTTAPPPPAPLRAAVKGRVRVKTGKRRPVVPSDVACSGPVGESCRVTERLVVVEKVRSGKVIGVTARAKRHRRRTVHRTVVLATSTASIRVGGSRGFTLKLNGAGRRLLTKRHRLPAEFLAILTVSRRQTTFAHHKLKLKLPKKKHKKHHR